MIKKLFFMVLVFIISYIYLYQRVTVYIEAYELNKSCKKLNKLVDIRDNLLYNFSRKASLAQINYWVDANDLKVADSSKVVAFNPGGSKKVKNSKINVVLSSLKRIFRISGGSKALAQEQNSSTEVH